MSISRLPRLYFDGHFHWNPSTNNNDDYGGNGLTPYDKDLGTPAWPWLDKQTFDGEPVTESNFRDWSYQDIFQLSGDVPPPGQLAPTEWNFFGGMECGFVTKEQPELEEPDNPDAPGTPVFSKPTGDQTTFITGYTGTDGVYRTDGAEVGLELQFNTAAAIGPFPASAKLIDIDPTSPFTSQVFVDDFRLGDGTNGLSAPVSQRMHARWLYFARNMNEDDGLMIAGIASTVFQTGLRNSEIDWTGSSPALEELRAAAEQGEGVMFRMAAYDTRYFNGAYFGEQGGNQFPGMLKIRDLYLQYFKQLEAFKQGLTTVEPPPPCNRAYSRVVGWLGVWDQDEFVTFPGGRLLAPGLVPNEPVGSPTPAAVHPQNVIKVRAAKYAKGFPFGPATVERNDDFSRITVDLISTIPEHDSSGAFGQFGSAELGIMIDGAYQPLVELVADTATYESSYLETAGLLDIDTSTLQPVNGQALTVQQFDDNPLVLKATSYTPENGVDPSQWTGTPTVALAENRINAQTNTRGLYVNEPDPAVPGPTTQFTIDVRVNNALPTEQIGLAVAQYGDVNINLLSGADQPLVIFYLAPSGNWTEIGNTTVVDATSGSVTIGLRGAPLGPATAGGSLPLVVFLPVSNELVAASSLTPEQPVTDMAGVTVPSGPPALPLPPALMYAAVKVYPYHSQDLARFQAFLATNPDVEEANSWVYNQVYKTFNLLYPVMDFISTPRDFQMWRGRILEVTKPENFDLAGYMPPTRTLSATERKIIELYDDYISGVNAPGSPLRSPAPADQHPRRN